MTNSNMFPQQAQPVNRVSAGQLPTALRELNEESLGNGQVEASGTCSEICCFCEAEKVEAAGQCSEICCFCEAENVEASGMCSEICCFCEIDA